jgi:hypothetical protein
MAPGRRRQMEVYVTGAGGARPAVPVKPAALEARAARVMGAEAAAYIIGGAGSELTRRPIAPLSTGAGWCRAFCATWRAGTCR